MFICRTCGEKRLVVPEFSFLLLLSQGPCEFCGIPSACADVPSSSPWAWKKSVIKEIKKMEEEKEESNPTTSLFGNHLLRACRKLISQEGGLITNISTQNNTPWILIIHSKENSPWGQQLAIWKHTGAIYRMDGGAVEDEPFITLDDSDHPGS